METQIYMPSAHTEMKRRLQMATCGSLMRESVFTPSPRQGKKTFHTEIVCAWIHL